MQDTAVEAGRNLKVTFSNEPMHMNKPVLVN